MAIAPTAGIAASHPAPALNSTMAITKQAILTPIMIR
jgi:hypothetical protein